MPAGPRHPGWSVRSCGRQLLRRGRLQAKPRAINRSGSHDHFSQSCQGAIGATLADTWAVLRAIADRAGGDPGFVGLTGDVDFKKRTKPVKLGIVETYGWKATTEGARKAFGSAKQRLQMAGIDLRGRADDADIEAVEKSLSDALELTQAINAWEGRWPLNTYADLDATKLSQSGARPAEDRRSDDAKAGRRVAGATRSGARHLRQGGRELRCADHARRLWSCRRSGSA